VFEANDEKNSSAAENNNSINKETKHKYRIYYFANKRSLLLPIALLRREN